jgi:hypothetical protein
MRPYDTLPTERARSKARLRVPSDSCNRCLSGVLISAGGRAGRIAKGYPRRAFSTVAA